MFKDIMGINDKDIDKCLSYFVAQVRNKSRQDYKPNTLYEIICSIQHFMRKEGRIMIFFNEKEYALELKMKELSSRGLGLDKKMEKKKL